MMMASTEIVSPRAHIFSLGLIHVAHDSGSLDPEAARRRMEEALRANAARPLFTGTAVGRLILEEGTLSYTYAA